MQQEYYLNCNIKCCNALSEYEKGIINAKDKGLELEFNQNWLLSNKEIYKAIINKPIGLPPIILSFANNYLHIKEFYTLFSTLNIGIINDDDLDKIVSK